MDLSKVTRVEVIDHTSQAPYKYVHPTEPRYGWLGTAAEMELQDDGRTLKVFLTDSEIATANEVAEQMATGEAWRNLPSRVHLADLLDGERHAG